MSKLCKDDVMNEAALKELMMIIIKFKNIASAGQEQFKSLRTPFYRGSDVCLLVFSLTNRESFENLEYWKKEFFYHADVHNYEFPFVLLGNKSDATDSRVVNQVLPHLTLSIVQNMKKFER